MIVFKTIFKLIYKLKVLIILYTLMLFGITILNETANKEVNNFTESKPDVIIINKDNEYLSENYIDYMSKHSNLRKDIDTNNDEEINDALFYRDINFVVYLDDSFTKDILNGKSPNVKIKTTKDASSTYEKMMLDSYIKYALIYKDYYSGDSLTEKLNNTLEDHTKVNLKTELNINELQKVSNYYNFLNYAFLAGCVYVISMILSCIKEENVYKRTIISSYDYKKYNKIVLLANSILVIGMWLLYIVASIIIFKGLMFSLNGILYMINSFVFAILSLVVGFCIGTITQNKNALGGIVNVVALGTSFLCGAFVPLNYMPNYVISIAHILPSYYYISNNEIIKTTENLTNEIIKNLSLNILIMLIFIIILMLITNYINKKKQIIN